MSKDRQPSKGLQCKDPQKKKGGTPVNYVEWSVTWSTHTYVMK